MSDRCKDKRERRKSEPGDEDSDREDAGTDDESNKRQRIFEKNMPWYRREFSAQLTADSSCTKTREILGEGGDERATEGGERVSD